MKLIGIDFSLNSPSICIIHKDKMQLISITRDEHDQEWFLKKKKSPYPLMAEMPETHLIFEPKLKIPSEYSARERTKQEIFDQITNSIINVLLEYVDPITEDIYVAMEGIAFGAQGNSLIDLSMATSLLRNKLMDQILDGDYSQFYVFSPGTVKKHAGKGNFKKWEMYDALINSNLEILQESRYVGMLKENKIEFVLPSQNVKKPLDDLNDSVWVCLCLRSLLE